MIILFKRRSRHQKTTDSIDEFEYHEKNANHHDPRFHPVLYPRKEVANQIFSDYTYEVEYEYEEESEEESEEENPQP